MSRVEVVNFGCRLNIAEGEAIRQAATGAQDLVVFNSCAVTAEAERQVRQAIRRLKRERPEARIVVTGCAAETSRDSFVQMAEVDAVIPNRDKRMPERFGVPATLGAEPLPAMSGTAHARAFIEVQNGCDHDCTFCVTTLARGESRSIPAGPVIAAVEQAVARGHKEVILTGVDLTSYGADLPGQPGLGHLVERILRHVPTLPRLRLSSLDSIEVDDRLLDLICQEPRVMPHVHLSLQSGDDLILKRMKRRHSRADAVRLVSRLKAARPEIAIGADIIAGFPTEDDTMFENSRRLIDDCEIVFGHIFPYSPRPGTAAARMPQVSRETARARAEILRAQVGAHKAQWLSAQVGTSDMVLIERDGRTGHTRNNAQVEIINAQDFRDGPDGLKGQIMSVTMTASDGDKLMGVCE